MENCLFLKNMEKSVAEGTVFQKVVPTVYHMCTNWVPLPLFLHK